MDSNTGGLASKKLLLSITSWGLGKGYNGAPVVAPASGTLPILCHLLGSRPDATPGANSLSPRGCSGSVAGGERERLGKERPHLELEGRALERDWEACQALGISKGKRLLPGTISQALSGFLSQ